jgi:hypothetical protein
MHLSALTRRRTHIQFPKFLLSSYLEFWTKSIKPVIPKTKLGWTKLELDSVARVGECSSEIWFL